MKVYPVSEDALSSLAKSDFLLSLGSALATFFGGVLASLWITVSAIPQPVPDRVQGMQQIAVPLLIVFIIISVSLMLWGLISRQTGIGRIKRRARSQTIVQPIPLASPPSEADN
jgi:hypothetical protein